MAPKFVPRYACSMACFILASSCALAQHVGAGANVPRANTPSSAPIPGQLIIISGKVTLDEGAPLSEPAAIERLCHGTVKREGYTDVRGQFAIQLGQNVELSDASEPAGDAQQTTSAGLPIVGAAPVSNSMTRNVDAARRQLSGCQLRAVLPGFQSSTVLIVPDGNSWKLEVGTITLTRIENSQGTTISLTTLSAPDEARHAYQKAQKEILEQKYSSAEKYLTTAVEAYPRFAAAWTLLGEIHRGNNQIALARDNFNQAIAADPEFVNPYFGLAMLAFNGKDWEETIRYTDQVIRLNSSAFPLAHLYNASANFSLARMDAAEKSIRRFQVLDSEHRQPYSFLLYAQILGSRRDYDRAIEKLEEYLRLAPKAGNADGARELLRRYQQARADSQPRAAEQP
ncbi:MAG TPA: tetratricopeptide repeat protein [Candidatus Angelobacter sp.]|nr:tetratricopeptide repeat protein [Candidatus Angelobacter sp.]